MKKKSKRLYQVWLTIEYREDVDDSWQVKNKLLYSSKSKDQAFYWAFSHSYLETRLDPNDNGEHWLRIATLKIVKVR